MTIPGGALLGPGLSVLADEDGLPGAGVVFGALRLRSGYVDRDCKNLHQRIVGQHLQRIPPSTLRRTLPAVLLPRGPPWLEGAILDGCGRAVLDEVQQQGLTEWMQGHLLLGWAVCGAKDKVDALERRWNEKHQPVLNIDGTGHGAQLTRRKQAFREGWPRRS